MGLRRLTALRATAVDDDLEDLAERLVATAPAGTIGDDLTLLLLRHEPGTAPGGSAVAPVEESRSSPVAVL